MTVSLVLPLAVASPAAAAPVVPGFTDSVVFSGLTNPSAIEFASDGRVFVAEKSGLVRVFDSLSDPTPTTFADLRTQVHNFWDRGLLGMALHPSFPSDPRVYVLYTHDAVIGGTAPRWGTVGGTSDGCPTPPGSTTDGCVVSGRLSVLTASGNTSTGETVLIEDWCQQYPSHSVGDLRFGADGALYVTGGDGASFSFSDYGQDGSPVNPCGDPPGGVGGTMTIPTAQGGALRSQDLVASGDPVTLDGAVLRLNPNTGAAMAGNPLIGSPDPNARRIISHGFRNPFRFTIRPGTTELWVGDVGWGTWEEINRIANPTAPVSNRGWPCIEGGSTRPGTYQELDLCETVYTAGTAVAPHFAYRHGQTIAGESCATGNGSSISGLAFYNGGSYPAEFDGALFFADYSRSCIWVMYAGADGLPDPATVEPFIEGAFGPVQLKIGPGGDLFYPDFNAGTVRRVTYSPPAGTPVADAVATPSSGTAPLTVAFDGRGSADPNGDPLAYAWDLDGDGELDDSTSATPTFTYAGGDVLVRLRVTDPGGLFGIDTVLVNVASGQVQYVSDLPFTLSTNGWGPVERDRSNGEMGPADGGPITVGGTTYAKGVGVHAASEIRLAIPAGCSTFAAVVGIDDESGEAGSVTFSVLGGSQVLATTGVLTGTDGGESLIVNLGAATELRLVVAGGASVDSDHADWADARFLCGGAGNAPPAPVIGAPAASFTWHVDETVNFSGSATDAEDGTLPASALNWTLVLQHCSTSGCHAHTIQSWTGVASGSFAAPDHEYPSHLELRLTATDSDNASTTVSRDLQPETVDLSFATSPPGLQLIVGTSAASAPFTRTVIVGSTVGVGAPTPQVSGSESYDFSAWSNGGARNHDIVAPAAPATYTATFVPATGSVRYVSDLPFTLSTNGWGPVERDRSNGETGAADGGPITIAGITYPKGVGVHAASEIRLAIPAGCTSFAATVGIDDESGPNGSVTFTVLGGSTVLATSSVLTGADGGQALNVNLGSATELRLVVTGGANVDYDHADWADARLICDAPPPTNTPPVLTQPANQSSQEGVADSFQLAASDANLDPLTYGASGLPPGLTIAPSTGLISGTPSAGSASGSPYTVTATVSDGRGGTDDATFSWTVTAPPPTNTPPVLTQPANQSSQEGVADSFQLAASDANLDPLTFGASGLPPGLTIAPSTGLISGTPSAGSASGSPYTVTATVSDGRGGTDDATFSWTVTAPTPPPAPTGLSAKPTTEDTRLSWNAVSGAAGYHVYRATSSTGTYTRVNGALLTTPAFTDTSAPPLASSWYRVTAVAASGAESTPATTVAHRRIQLVGIASTTNNGASSLQVTTPTGRQVNDLMLVTITIGSAPTITPPAGWTLVRVDTSGSALRQAIYSRLVTASEPSTATFSFSAQAAGAATVALYRGVSTTTPIEAHSGSVNPASVQVATTPITTLTAHAVVVGAFGVAWNTTVTPPISMLDQAGASIQKWKQRATMRIADLVITTPSPTGTLTATVGRSAVTIGQLIALRPAAP